MRPSYSDVLAKSVPPLTPPLTSPKPPPFSGTTTKSEGRKQNSKSGKGGNTQNNSEDQTKANVRRWISLEDLTPPQSSEENSFIDYEAYIDESIGSGSDNCMQPTPGETKKEKKQKKKVKPSEEKCEALNNHKTAGGTQGGNKRPLHINNNLQGKTTGSEKNVTKNASKNSRSAQEESKKGTLI
ncbi:uncharacterized protein LOC124373392 [Homalodisca vitripennis]|uniref:uncharacterized protein LOC124373392 n=1 Tax=Homalodisca vitripennis TaxID=197043 RepID=UPI001EEC13DD|nr:uncharacterized protein LOC124373392 [Homalodisca vitripennis]